MKNRKSSFGIFYADEFSGIFLHLISSFPSIRAKVGVVTFQKNGMGLTEPEIF